MYVISKRIPRKCKLGIFKNTYYTSDKIWLLVLDKKSNIHVHVSMYSMCINNQKKHFPWTKCSTLLHLHLLPNLDEENQTSFNNELSQQMLLSLNESANI